MTRVSQRDWALSFAAFIALVLNCSAPTIRQVHAASVLPKVALSADSLAPRPIEQRTGEAVTHDYAQAWQDLGDALNSNRTDVLGDYFAGEAKLRITHRVAEQTSAHMRTRYVDGGHRVNAIFYSLDGGEMQLEDQVQLQIQVFDGNKMVYSSNTTQKYLVLMTPGSDRWYVRYLESVGDTAF